MPSRWEWPSIGDPHYKIYSFQTFTADFGDRIRVFSFKSLLLTGSPSSLLKLRFVETFPHNSYDRVSTLTRHTAIAAGYM